MCVRKQLGRAINMATCCWASSSFSTAIPLDPLGERTEFRLEVTTHQCS